MIYLITGYGPINSTLRKRMLTDSSTCPMCEETPEHMIFTCAAYERVRFSGIESYRNARRELIANENMLPTPNKLAKQIFTIRKGGLRSSLPVWDGLPSQ